MNSIGKSKISKQDSSQVFSGFSNGLKSVLKDKTARSCAITPRKPKARASAAKRGARS